jgi:hypothetical protein
MSRAGARYAAALLAGAALVACCAALAHISNLAEAPRAFLLLSSLAFVCYGVGAWLLACTDGARAIMLIVAVAGAARLVLLPVAPTLSTDAYRYLWDARVSSHRIDPYAYAAGAPQLAALRDDAVYPRLNHPTWRTVYPPAAQVFFRLVRAAKPDSMPAMKIVLGLAEALGLGLLFGVLKAWGLPATRAVIYAWNPLVLIEIWGTAHLDALVIPCVIGSVWAAVAGRQALAGALLGVAAGIKLYPAALVAVVLVGPGSVSGLAAFAAVLLASYGTALSVGWSAFGSLPRYVSEEYFNPGLFRAVVDLPWFAAAVALLWILFVWSRRRDMALQDRVVLMIGGLLLLSPNLFPWYALWLVPFLAAVPSLPWIAFTGTVTWAYAFFLEDPWAVPRWARLIEFAPLAAGALWFILGGRAWIARPARSA